MDINECKSDFEFVGSSIKELTIKNDLINFPLEENAEKLCDVEYMIHDISESKTELTGYVNLYVDVLLKLDNKQSKIHLEIEGCFAKDKSDDSESTITFCKLLSANGCALLYSVARAVLLTTTSQVFNSGSVKLPMINCYKLRQNQEE